MRRGLLFFLLLYLSIVIQISFAYLPTPHWKIDLPFFLILYLGLSTPLFPGGFGVLAAGLFLENQIRGDWGILSLSYLVVYLMLRLAKGRFFLEGGVSLILWIFILTLIQKGIVLVWLGRFLWGPWLVTAGLEAMLGSLLIPWIARLDRIATAEE